MLPDSLKTLNCLGGKCSEASSGSRTGFPLIHPSLDRNTEPSWARLVGPPFRRLTLIMQSDGGAGTVLTLNPRFRCAGTSGIQLHHNWTTIVSQNVIYTSVVLEPDTFHPISLQNSGRKMIRKGWKQLFFFLCTHKTEESIIMMEDDLLMMTSDTFSRASVCSLFP